MEAPTHPGWAGYTPTRATEGTVEGRYSQAVNAWYASLYGDTGHDTREVDYLPGCGFCRPRLSPHSLDFVSMMTCRRCCTPKPKNQFSGRMCRACKAEAERRRRDANRKQLRELKQTLECSRCGEDNPTVLQFHHTDPTQKSFNVSRAVSSGYSWAAIENEIAKCECVCANCHLIIEEEIRYGEQT